MKKTIYTTALLVFLAVGLVACQSGPGDVATPESPSTSPDKGPVSAPASKPAPTNKGGTLKAKPPAEGLAVATFAGGCFWCMETPFEELDGVKDAISGYTGGKETAPTYKQVSAGRTSHTEAVQVIYDPKVVTYDALLNAFWRSMDPTDLGGQFVDRGPHYRPGIFVHDDAQKQKAEASKAALEKSKRFKKPIVVPIQPAADFWIAEEYHQDYYKKSTNNYKRYRYGSGRDKFIEAHWGEK